MASASPKTILFLLLNPGYARFYDGVVRAPAEEAADEPLGQSRA